MKPTLNKEPLASLTQLVNFLQRVLSMTPNVLWWLIGALLFIVLNLAFQDEVWVNTLNADVFFIAVGVAVFVSLAWVVSNLAWRVADTVNCEPWSTLWRWVAVLGFIGSTVVTAILLLMLLLFWLPGKVS